MPELPDVEALRRYLVPLVRGRTVVQARTDFAPAVQVPSALRFSRLLRGQRVLDIRRRAKYLIIELSGGQTLVLHLGMTGVLVVSPARMPRHRFAHHVFSLDDGNQLQFLDPRKLGRMWLVKDSQEVLAHLGPEPLEAGLTAPGLARQIGKTSSAVKAILCEQSVVAGLGNIYADEVLFAAGIHPLRKAKELSEDDATRLLEAMRQVLPKATEGLLKLLPLTDPPSESQEGRVVLQVPRKAGAPCLRCGTPIRRVPVRGRSTYFCPACQRK